MYSVHPSSWYRRPAQSHGVSRLAACGQISRSAWEYWAGFCELIRDLGFDIVLIGKNHRMGAKVGLDGVGVIGVALILIAGGGEAVKYPGKGITFIHGATMQQTIRYICYNA